MEHEDIEETRKALEDSLARLKGLASWVALKEDERKPGMPPLGTLSPTELEEVRNAKARFAGAAWEALLALNRHGSEHGATEATEAIRKQVSALVREAGKLCWPKGL